MKLIKKTILFTFILLYTISNNFSIVFAKEALLNGEQFEIDLHSNNIAIYDINNGFLLYGKDEDEIVFPASTTKLMTALLLIENTQDIDETRISFTSEAVDNLEYNAVSIGMNVGDTLSVRDSLYALLLASANEVANAIAIHVSGSIDNFGDLMTERAKELGALNTNFKNPSGLHNDDHYTTAYDMSLIITELSKYDIFNEIASTTDYEIPPTETNSEPRFIKNTNKLINENSIHFNEDVLGSKTGFTSKAGYNLATFAKDNRDIQLAVSTLDSTSDGRFIDTNELLDYAFEIYSDVNVAKEIPIIESIFQEDENKNYFIKLNLEPVNYKIPVNTPNTNVWYVTNLKKKLTQNMNAGENLGTIDFYIGKNHLGRSDLILQNDLNINNNFSEYLNTKFFNASSLKINTPFKNIFNTLIKIAFLLVSCAIIYIQYDKYKKRKIRKRIYQSKRKRKNTRKYQNSYKYKQKRRGNVYIREMKSNSISNSRSR